MFFTIKYAFQLSLGYFGLKDFDFNVSNAADKIKRLKVTQKMQIMKYRVVSLNPWAVSRIC